jgi:preprotein translocase subunit Sec61beta
MAKQNKINMPQSGGGLTRYFDDYESKIMFDPQSVVLFILACIVIIVLLQTFGGATQPI